MRTSLCSPGKLNILSLRRLGYLLRQDEKYLRLLASRAGGEYDPFPKLPKRRPFQKREGQPKTRIIDNPSDALKKVQALIDRSLLKPLAIPDYLCGGVKGKTVLDNIRNHSSHASHAVLVKIDIAKFFPSITNLHVYRVWRGLLGCSRQVSALLTRLTTYERHLPQGAPTSTSIANLVLYMCDSEIREKCVCLGINYSTWIDDLAFSSEDPRPIIDVVFRTLKRAGFRVSRRKLEIIGPGKRKVLNGVLIGKAPGIPPEKLKRIRSGIHKLRVGKIPANQLSRYSLSLRGSIAHISGISPAKGRKLRESLESCLGAAKAAS